MAAYSFRVGLVTAAVFAAVAHAGEPPAADSARVCPGFDFSTVPTNIRPLVRAGMFQNPPTGPGYYSLLDAYRGTCRETAPMYPYPPAMLSTLSQFDADWRFVDSPEYDPDLLERLKRIRIGENWLLATGGQTWYRYQNEYNARLSNTDSVETLVRARPYVDLWYKDLVRFYVEGTFSDSVQYDVPPLPTDINRADFQNLFADLRLGEAAGVPVYARVGRQEIQLGSQRLVGTPDWGNNRRTFQGVRFLRTGETFDADLFWVQPVVVEPSRLDSGDNNLNFAGAWLTYKPRKGTYLDAYYLMLDHTTRLTQLGLDRSPITLHTVGGRYVSDRDDTILWDVEGAMQLGTRGTANVVAGMATAGVGYHAKGLPMNPTVWAYYNYTSGDPDPGAGTYHTFHQLFPFIHYYIGWVDAVGRQNSQDLNLRLYLYPAHWATVWLQYHRFWLAESKDALYNVFGVPTRRDPTGQSGIDVGHKAEVLVNFHLTKRIDFLTGYSYLWGGRFLQTTAGPNLAASGSLFWFGTGCRW